MKINLHTGKNKFTIEGDLDSVKRDIEQGTQRHQFIQYKNEKGFICFVNAANVDMIEATEEYVRPVVNLPAVPVAKKETYTKEQLEAQPLLAVYGGRVLDEKSGL
jgi:hypothetical protein